jgi:hypothetical protein
MIYYSQPLKDPKYPQWIITAQDYSNGKKYEMISTNFHSISTLYNQYNERNTHELPHGFEEVQPTIDQIIVK